MYKINAISRYFLFTLFTIFVLTSCQSTQKTTGEGLISVVAQNVLKIAGNQAIENANFSNLNNVSVTVELKGFVEQKTEGFIQNLVSSSAEKSGALLIRNGKPDIIIEAVVNSAGNDQGSSRVPVINRALRTESVVDLTIIFRNPDTGKRLSTQNIRGEAKYEQKTWVGIIDESGKYYVKTSLSNKEGIGDLIRSDISNSEWTQVKP
ncbi:hypothetical protein N9M76_02445 [Gammaproteobacteria bacterium]|jgi:hypothetical protein|nr:hypothetical protein [Gammaproteobacteria bacterium]